MSFRTNALKVQAFAGALYGVQVGTTTMAQVNADITSGGFTNTLNSYYASSFGNVANATVAASVAANLGLTGDALASGTAYITAQLNAAAAGARGAVISTILDQFAGLTADATFGAAATAYNAKVDAANAYTGAANVAIGSTVGQGTSFTLTAGADTVAGTSGNDTINASLVYTGGATTVDATSTISVADQISGGAGTDTLNVTISGGNAATFVATNITGVEVLNLRNVAGVANSLDVSTIAGVTAVNADRGNSALTLTNLPAGSSFGLVGNGAVVNAAAQAVGYATGSTVTAATINLSGGTLGASAITLTGANLLSTTINSTGAANVTGAFVDAASSKALTINATTGLTTGTIGDSAARTALTINATGDVTTGAVTSSAAVTAAITGAGKVTTDLNAVVAPTISVSGSGAVSIGTLNAASTTLTSTQTAGSLTATMNAVATTKVTGGAGNDVITTGAVLTTGFADGGAGTDTLVIGTNVAHINTTALAAKFTNFETLRLNGTLDMAVAPSSINAIELTAATNSITNMTAAQAAAVTAYGTTIGASTLTLASSSGTSDVLNLKLGTGLTTAAAANTGILTATGFETINLSTNHGPTATAIGDRTSTITGAIADTSLTNVNLAGSAFVFTDIASSKAVAWNGSALIGDGNTTAASIKGLTVAGNAFAGSTITGSNFVDNFTIGAVGSTYNAGSGDDLVISTQAVFAGSIADGGAGTKDVARITDTAATTAALTINDNAFGGLTGFETIDFSGAVAGDFLWTLGGYANAIATANGGAITATATALATAVTGDIITVDASGLAGTNALKLTMTNTGLAAAAVTAATTITGSNGADTIVYSEAGVAGGNNQRTITVSGGAGNDTITVSSVAVGAVSIDGGSGNDTITGSAQVDTITGGTGADTMTGNAGVDTFVFSTNGSVAGTAMDIITDMAATDVLQFGAGTLVLLGADATAAVAGSNVQQSAGGLITFATADNTLALKVAAVQADAQLDAAQSVAFFVDSGNTYVYYAGAAVGNTDDQIVQLTGVTALATITVGGASASSMVIA